MKFEKRISQYITENTENSIQIKYSNFGFFFSEKYANYSKISKRDNTYFLYNPLYTYNV